VASGRLLYSKNGRESRAPASLTKIMTALLSVETAGPDDVVTVSARAASAGGSSVWLAEGETHTVRDLLYALMLRSGNDAAVALAEHAGGTEDHFVLLMNRRAARIGASDTHFRNPHGLPARGHVTTAADLALIAREALLRPDFSAIVATRRYTMPWSGKPWDRALYNENRLLWLYPGADGVKTGWTTEAGRCLVASASRNGLRLAAVLLDAPQMWTDAAELLDWGFGAFRSVVLYPEGARVTRARLAGATERYVGLLAARDVAVALVPGEEDNVYAVPEAPPFVVAPVEEGAEAGVVRVVVNGQPLGGFPLRVAEPVPAGGIVGRFFRDIWVILRLTLERLLGFSGREPDVSTRPED